jgi:hypothetical protein
LRIRGVWERRGTGYWSRLLRRGSRARAGWLLGRERTRRIERRGGDLRLRCGVLQFGAHRQEAKGLGANGVRGEKNGSDRREREKPGSAQVHGNSLTANRVRQASGTGYKNCESVLRGDRQFHWRLSNVSSDPWGMLSLTSLRRSHNLEDFSYGRDAECGRSSKFQEKCPRTWRI